MSITTVFFYKALKILCFELHIVFRQEIRAQMNSTMTGLLLPNTISQKDTTIPQIKIKITKIPLEKKLNTAIPQSPPPQHD